MALSPIFESFNQDRSRSMMTDLCVNVYPEHTDGDKGPEISLLVSCPGLTAPLVTAGDGPIRFAYRAANDLMYVVSGASVYVVSKFWVATLIGAIGTSSGSIQVVDGLTQVLLVDGTGAWCIVKATNVMTRVIPSSSVSAFNPASVVYQDGFALINSTDNQIYQSGYNDLSVFTTSGVANNAYIQGNAEPVVTMFDMKREVWIFKNNAVEMWVNNGNPGFAFAPLQGVYIPVGCAAAASVARLGDSMIWLGEDEQGNATVFMSVGYQAKVISTNALVTIFQSYSTVSDATAYAYQANDHRFYVLTFPTGGDTYVYDLATNKWHQRASFVSATGQLFREIPSCHCWFNKKHVVGDYRNGNLYALSDTTYTDNGAPRKWLRSWRALMPSQPQGIPMSFDELQILMESGITAPDGSNPQIMLRWSDDGGYTWIAERLLAAGKVGQTAQRVISRCMGSTKIGTGLDRVWEISGTDPIRILITGATFEGGPA